jgi:hypothetical protein
MTSGEVLETVTDLLAVAREVPEIAHAISGLFGALHTDDPENENAAWRHLEAVASATALGLPTESL